MVKKTKEQRGITLIALVITIIVLIILGAVSLVTLTGDNGLITRAIQARNDSKIKQEKELINLVAQTIITEESLGVTTDDLKLQNYINEAFGVGKATGTVNSTGNYTVMVTETGNIYTITSAGVEEQEGNPPVASGPWTQSGTTITNTQTNSTISVGTVISNYTSGVEGYTDTNGWAVLGVENGCLLLMSTVNIPIEGTNLVIAGSNGRDNGMSYLAGWSNAVEVMDGLCEDYVNSTYASEARTVKVEDINNITGYNPNDDTSNSRYGEWLSFYNKLTDKSFTTGIYCATAASENAVKQLTSSSYTSTGNTTLYNVGSTINLPEVNDGTEPTDSQKLVVMHGYYSYSFSSSNIDELAYNLIYGTSAYWLGSPLVYAENTANVAWEIRYVTGNGVYCSQPIWSGTNGARGDSPRGVRAVIRLLPGVIVTQSGETTTIGI